ncbi:Host attachment protein [Rhodobacterales bacterium HKCCE3408]|nr:Host attachment protein [Rhodobacterales bacterium HKCCE3408]
MTELSHGTWVLIADGEKALFMRNVTDAEDPYLEVIRETEQVNPPDRDQSANRPGRFNDGPRVQRSSVEDTDWHRLAKDRFAADLAEILFRRAQQNAFDRLVIAAAPHVLGELRKDLHKEVSNRVVAEIPKDFTNHPVDEIESRLKSELAS